MDEHHHHPSQPLLLHGFNSTTDPRFSSSSSSSSSSFLTGRAATTTGAADIMTEPPSPSSSVINQQQSEWGYSKPVIVLDVIWNLAFVLVSIVLLSSTSKERPSTPLRIWISGYALQCLFHVGFVYFEYRRRNSPAQADVEQLILSSSSSSPSLERPRSSVMKRLESMNTMVSFFWWMIGFYWIVVGGQALLQDAPRLYWLAVVFLAFDVFFAIFCILLACIVGVALCCCLPCVLAILYAVAVQEGASEDDIKVLPRYRYRQNMASDLDTKPEVAVAILDLNSISEITLPPEDSECCICLNQYVDGVELHGLPCNHHFHCGCIDKWLRINATCPLCKYNILNSEELV